MRVFWYLSAALEVFMLFRIVRLKLVRKSPYSAFAVMQSVMLFRDLVLLLVPIHTIQYTVTWEITLPAILIVEAWAGISCYGAIARLYPKIGRFAVWLFAAALLASAMVSFAGLPLELARLRPEPILRSMLLCYRWTDTLLAGGLILAVGFLRRFPSPLRRLPSNLFRHTALLACYFSLYAAAYLLPANTARQIDSIRMALVCGLYAAWTLALSKRGEETEAWPDIDGATGKWITDRSSNAEKVFHQAAQERFASSLQISRPK